MSKGSRAVTAQFHLDTAHLKDGLVTLVIPIDDKIARLIGLIVAQWGAFEVRMNGFIDGFHKAMRKSPPPNWQRLNFRTRRSLFKDTYREYLPQVGWQVEIAPLDKICNAAADLHWRRNIVVHGFYRYHWEEDGNGNTVLGMTAFGVHNKRDVSLDLDEETLSKLFHDIAHVNGDLMARFAKRGVSIDNVELLIEDRSLLQGPERGTFQTLPTPNRP